MPYMGGMAGLAQTWYCILTSASIIPPKGAFYAFPSYEADVPSADLAAELASAGLICTPGSAFGSYGEGHLRFSYAADESKIQRGMDILADVMSRRSD